MFQKTNIQIFFHKTKSPINIINKNISKGVANSKNTKQKNVGENETKQNIFRITKQKHIPYIEKFMKIKEKYNKAKSAKVGEECICPSCGNKFIKDNYQQAFCKTKSGTKCKDKYWNSVTPKKRCNTTRISPASAAFMERSGRTKETDEGYKIIDGVAYDEWGDAVYNIDKYDRTHPFDLE